MRPKNWQLKCSRCNESFGPDELVGLCPSCNSPILVEYDLEEAARLFARLQSEQTGWPESLYDFWPALPLAEPDRVVRLGEQVTPLYRLPETVHPKGGPEVWVKDESYNPTGTFKARGMALALHRARELGVSRIVVPSAGNAASAAAAYAARLGMQCAVIVPQGTPSANIAECIRYGAKVAEVPGSIADAGRIAARLRDRYGLYDVSTLKEPYRLEGKKTMGYELFLQWRRNGSGGSLPDVIVYPTGGGTGLIGLWKAFDELAALGWLTGWKRPRMVAVQAAGCCPIVRAFESGAERAEPWPDPSTIASGLRVPAAVGDFLMLLTLRQSGGTAVAVSDDEIRAARAELARHAGLDFSPESAATWAGCKRLIASGWIQQNETVVLFHTGTGLKYQHLDQDVQPRRLDPEVADWPELDAGR